MLSYCQNYWVQYLASFKHVLILSHQYRMLQKIYWCISGHITIHVITSVCSTIQVFNSLIVYIKTSSNKSVVVSNIQFKPQVKLALKINYLIYNIEKKITSTNNSSFCTSWHVVDKWSISLLHGELHLV